MVVGSLRRVVLLVIQLAVVGSGAPVKVVKTLVPVALSLAIMWLQGPNLGPAIEKTPTVAFLPL